MSRIDTALALLIFGAAVCFFQAWAVSDELGGIGGDNAVYALTARHYAPSLTSDPVAADFAAQSQYPPLYPLTLAVSSPSLRLAHWITILELASALALLFCWARQCGLARTEALLMPGLFAIAPGTLVESLQLHSEMLFLALTLLALLRISIAQRSSRTRDYFIAGIAVTAAALTRTVGAALFIPLAVAMLRAPARTWLLVALSATPFFAWHLVHSPSGSYAHVWAERSAAVPLWSGFARGLVPLRAGWSATWTDVAALSFAMDAVMVLCLLAAIARAWRREPDGIFILVYLLVVAAWDFPAESQRFVWPLAAIGLAAFAVELRAWSGRIVPSMPRVGTAALLAALAACVLPSALLAAQRAQLASAAGIPAARFIPEWYGADALVAEQNVATYFATMRALARTAGLVPPGHCVLSIKPSVTSLITGRRSVGPPSINVADAEFAAAIDASGCDYALLLAYLSPSYPAAMYPAERLPQQQWQERFHEIAEIQGAAGEAAILMQRVAR